METVILIKYGELTTKRGNRNQFINTLLMNIKDKLDGINVEITKDRSRMYIECSDNDLETVKERLRYIFGIHMYHVAYIVNTDTNEIKDTVLNALMKEAFTTFKVETKRSDKSFSISSMEFNPLIATCILKNIKDIKVDVHNPDIKVHIEIRGKKSYVYFNAYKGLGGYPVGTQKKGLLMLSGGIDSPVAGYLALKRGISVDCVYFEALPHTSLQAREKVISLSKQLKKYSKNLNLHIVNFTKLQEEIYKNSKDSYCITIMRRMMYRIMEKLSNEYNAYAIINGESIGQVASQTLTSMQVINSVTNMPVIRPVACLDKLEIIDIAKKIDTYEISILPFEDCCTVFVPKHPSINPNINEAIKYESGINYEEMIDDIVRNIYTIKIENDSDFTDLL